MKVVSISALLVFSAGLVGLSIAVAPTELSPYLASVQPEPVRFESLASQPGQTGVSGVARLGLLSACDATSVGAYAMFQPTELRVALWTRCRSAAYSIVERAPLYGAAWTTIAELSALLGDGDAFRSAMLQSRRTSPNLYAYAARRLRIAAGSPQLLDAAVTAAVDDDIRTLATTYMGASTLAAHYVNTPQDRSRVATAMETTSNEQQRLFLDRVRAVQEGIGQ